MTLRTLNSIEMINLETIIKHLLLSGYIVLNNPSLHVHLK